MQNSISIKKPKDHDSYQLIKSGSNLTLQYFSQSITPQLDSSKLVLKSSLEQGEYTNALGYGSHAEGIGFLLHPDQVINTTGLIYFQANDFDNNVISSTTSTIVLEGDTTSISTPYTLHDLYITDGTYAFQVNEYYYTVIPVVQSMSYNAGLNQTTLTIDPPLQSQYMFVEGKSNTASGYGAHAEGYSTTAIGTGSHAEGNGTQATGTYSHAEGNGTSSSGTGSHAEGNGAQSAGTYSHAEGAVTLASGSYSHAEGYLTTAQGSYSHAEGQGTVAQGNWSHAEGNSTLSLGDYSHAEGFNSFASGSYTHAEGYSSQAKGWYSHAEGLSTNANGPYSHAEGNGAQSSGTGSHAEGNGAQATGTYSHAEGSTTIASGLGSHAEGSSTNAAGNYSHAEGYLASAQGDYSHAEGQSTKTTGQSSHAEGQYTLATGVAAHTEGYFTTASVQYAHAEGTYTQATGIAAHSEGNTTLAQGGYSHAEGYYTTSSGNFSHAEGSGSKATGVASHAEGSNTTAQGDYSHAEGLGTVTSGSYQLAIGQYNVSSSAQSAFIVGNGTSTSARSNLIYASGSNVQITGSLGVTGSFGLLGNSIHTGSVYHSGSKFLNGNFVQTGSMNISGSTTQIGTNNLFGNTTLSGSIIISGSTTVPATPTIKVYGDMETNGVIKFTPVVKTIDSSISGSYIYVSGSTNDLYFSQNGSGYSNSTRLRWIEGSLYTGLLSGGVISSTLGSTTFNVSAGSGIIVSLNAFTSSTDPFPTIQYVNWPTYTGLPITNSGSAKITYLSMTSAGTVAQQTVPIGSTDVSQWDTQIELGVVLHLSGSVSTGVYNAPQVGYGFTQRTDDFLRAFGPLKISGHTLQASGSTLGLVKTSGTAYNNGANYVNNPNHPSTVSDPAISTSKIYRYYVSGSTPIIDTGALAAGYTVIDPGQYNNNGTLASVPGGQYSIQRVYWIPNSPTNAFIVYYGNAKYNSVLDANNAIQTEVFTEAPNTAQNGILLGYIIVAGNETNLTNATIVQGGLFRTINGIGNSNSTPISNTFSGLSDVSVASRAANDLLTYNGSQWVNTKSLTGNYSINGNLTVTGSVIGTASLASTASYAPNYVLTSATSSMSVASASFATTASYITGSVHNSANPALSASYASTASYVNPLRQDVQITGSLGVTGSVTISSTPTIPLQVGTSTLILSSSKVGIGTATPQTALEIAANPFLRASTSIYSTTPATVNSGDFYMNNGNIYVKTGNMGGGQGTGPGPAGNQARNILGLGLDASPEVLPTSSSYTHDSYIGSSKYGLSSIAQTGYNYDLKYYDRAITASGIHPDMYAGGLLTMNNWYGSYAQFYFDDSGRIYSRGDTVGTTPRAWRKYIAHGDAYSGSLVVNGNTSISGSFTVSGSSILSGSTQMLGATNITGSLGVGGTTLLSGSFNTAISGSILKVIGSGSTQPIFTVQGSQGELFSVTDSLSGSLFSVNDISGLPILEVFSDNTTLIGNYQAPALVTTAKNVLTNSGSFTVYSLPTASYDGAFFEYTAKSGSNARAGSIIAIWSGTSVNYTETTTTDFGTTTGLSFNVSISGSNMVLTGSASTTAWTVKTIIRSI